ncbi:MutS protein 1 [Coemansia aciculifera]|uniref:DNA mismatch repair protein n=1 Tax=Coemansia aciculifera TaxID=417176 RepID=A0A9W8IDD2_9FUNG|nr:MutS protein 1 [Coemansia aciculifera]
MLARHCPLRPLAMQRLRRAASTRIPSIAPVIARSGNTTRLPLRLIRGSAPYSSSRDSMAREDTQTQSGSGRLQHLADPEEEENPAEPVISTSAVLNTARDYRQKYPDCVLLVRVGDFYELYFEQADDIGGHILGLQVVDKKFRAGSVRFTGFPARSLLRYVEILVVRHGLSVALCEQFQEPMRRSFTRKVTRIITPGTLIDDQCLADTRVHNYILCIAQLDRHQIEYQARLTLWRREKALLEERHRESNARILAAARREWQQQLEPEQQLERPKRRPGRPPKSEALVMKPPRPLQFDPSSVPLPEAPAIPPMPVLDSHIQDPATTGEEDTALCLAWLDLATGDFMTCISSADALSADLARIRPKEILVDKDNSAIRQVLASVYPTSASTSTQPLITNVLSDSFYSRSSPLEPSLHTSNPPGAEDNTPNGQSAHCPISAPSARLISSPEHILLESTELSSGEQAASCALLNYILDTQLGLLPPLQPPKRYRVEGHMRMSAATIQALELLQPSNGGERGNSAHTLLGEIDHTKTSAGGRLLAKRLTAPSTEIGIIEQRLDLVEFFNFNSRVRDQIYERLDNIGDVERAVNKLSLNCGGPHDLLDIARTLGEVSKIKSILKAHLDASKDDSWEDRLADLAVANDSATLSGWSARRRSTISRRLYPATLDIVRRKELALLSLESLVRDIDSKIRKDAERDVRVFGFLRPDCSDRITNLHRQLVAKDLERKQLQLHWQMQFKCSSLRLDTIPALGHFIEVSKRDSERLADSTEFRMIQSLKSKVRFENNQWTYLLSEIEMLKSTIQAEEMRVFEELRDSVLEASASIRTNSKVLADLDVAISMSLLASARQYVRPRFVSTSESLKDSTEGDMHVIVNGRHPVVESQLLASNRQYVGNDCTFSDIDSRVLLLTGPNMGGKSTFLRQTALISILAQVGSFVPADDAQLRVFDAIYSRIGARDNLALDQSTFMVEMSETADILKHATANSLVILDEIGRGTSTVDGISVAYATLRYLHDRIRCKAVFATHYHELVPHVVPELSAIQPLQTAIYEDGLGGFAFLHKVKPGICDKSHALYVAQIAGIPKEVLATARNFAASRLALLPHK